MPQKRRERDRPKAGPESLYNPNKRLALSYESDDEAEPENLNGTGHPAALDCVTADYEIEEYPSDEASDEYASVGAARKVNDAAGASKEDENGEEQSSTRKNDKSLGRRDARKNNATGQWPAIGSLSYQWKDAEEDENYDSTEEEAMEYLRAVRYERQNMPSFFKAPSTHTHEEIYDSGRGDTRGYFEDGAYVANPTVGPTPLPEAAKTTLEPQEAFTLALKDRFLKQRQRLRIPPDLDVISELDDKHPTTFTPNNNKAYASWHRALRSTVPQPLQISAMTQDTLFQILELVQKHYLVREKEITTCTSSWIWSLLARLDDVGSMNNDQVYTIREFGKKAILVNLSFQDPEAARQLEDAARDEVDVESTTNTTAAIVRAETLSSESNDNAHVNEVLPSSPTSASKTTGEAFKDGAVRQNTLATLDTIIVLVGEVFGQRDLLEFRQPWTSSPEENGKGA